MTNIILFQFETNKIRFVGTADKPEWIADDICKALDLENTSKALEGLEFDEKGITKGDTLGGEQEMLTVTESGLYRLIFKSRKPAAKRMKKWVFSEVLPSIRKTGSYSIPTPIPQLPSRELAVETAVAIDRIQDILSKSNPRLAQILIDCAMNDVVESSQAKLSAAQEFPEDRWHSLVSIADRLGVKTNSSTRVKLGNFVGKLGLERVRESRLCNGEMRPIWCYRDDEDTQQAIREWETSIAE
jgi:prophage antirepressor-like protein